MKTYFIGFIKGSKHTNVWNNGHRDNTLIVQARRNLDSLSPDLWRYFGERVITKTELKRKSIDILISVNKNEGTNFNRVVID